MLQSCFDDEIKHIILSFLLLIKNRASKKCCCVTDRKCRVMSRNICSFALYRVDYCREYQYLLGSVSARIALQSLAEPFMFSLSLLPRGKFFTVNQEINNQVKTKRKMFF